MIKNFIFSLLFVMCSFSCLEASDKLYFDIDAIPKDEDAFHIPVGDNVWIETHAIHRDTLGFFTYESDITEATEAELKDSLEYKKMWKCPYCNLYSPMGKPCQNKDCPSKFRGHG